MRDFDKRVDLASVNKFKVRKDKLKLSENKDIVLDRYAIVGQLGKNKPTILALNVSSAFDLEQPSDVVAKYLNKESKQEALTSCTLSPDLKHIIMEVGLVTGKNHRTKLGSVRPFETVRESGAEIRLYRLDIHRYDTEKNNSFLVLEAQTDNKDSIYIDFKNKYQITKFYERMKYLSTDLTLTRKLREYLYRYYTKNKSNDYKGYIRVSDIPRDAKGAIANLSELIQHLAEHGTNKYGENTLSIFIAWMSYYNSKRCSGDIIKETLNPIERNHFNKVFKGIEELIF